MSESIITGLFTLSGIIITSIISIIVQKIQIKANDISSKMDRSISDMIDDLIIAAIFGNIQDIRILIL